MRPAWQVDAISIQLKHLEAQKDHLISLVDHIDTTIHDINVWINGRKNKTLSFIEMCTYIESTFSDVSTKCLEIYREQQYDHVVSEEEDKASDLHNVAGTETGQPDRVRKSDCYVKEDRSTVKGKIKYDSLKKNVVKKSREVETNNCNTTDDISEHFLMKLNNMRQKLDLFSQDLETVKINEVENSHKLESVLITLSAYNELIYDMQITLSAYNELNSDMLITLFAYSNLISDMLNLISAYNELMSDMQLKMYLLQTSQSETKAALKDLSNFTSPLKTEVEMLSHEFQSTGSNLHSCVDELKSDCEHIKQKLSNSQDQKDQRNSGILTENIKVKQKNEHLKDGSPEEDGTDKSQVIGDTDESQEEDCTDDSQEEDDTYVRCKKKDESTIFYGTHETQESGGGEADLYKYVFGCKKNPGHKNFVPVNDFNITHLPKGYYDYELVEIIKSTADLTVRVALNMTSTERPEFWPNTNETYPFYDRKGSDVMRLGTGLVTNVNKWNEEVFKRYNWGTCICNKCQHSDTPSIIWGELKMLTASQVVFDELEARHTKCRFFYDRPSSPRITLDGWTISNANITEDWCELKCVTCDLDLLDKLEKIERHWRDLWDIVFKKYKSNRDKDKLIFIVSHPHGCPKRVSVGHWINKYNVSGSKSKYTYTTCTCPGSSGAYVHSLGYYDDWVYARHVHSGVNSEGINFSGAGRDWS